jgi:hypothetical protein
MIRKNSIQIMRLFGSSKTFMDLEDKYGCHNYAPLDVVIERGQGIHVWDCEGNCVLKKAINTLIFSLPILQSTKGTAIRKY